MLFLAFEDPLENFTTGVIPHTLTMSDRILQKRDRLHLDCKIGLEDFVDRFANLEFVDCLEVRQAAQEKNALSQHVGVLHLVDGFMPLVFSELGDAPIGKDAVVQPVLVDCGQFVGECLVQELDDLFIALHGKSLRWNSSCRLMLPETDDRKGGKGKKWRNSASCERYSVA